MRRIRSLGRNAFSLLRFSSLPVQPSGPARQTDLSGVQHTVAQLPNLSALWTLGVHPFDSWDAHMASRRQSSLGLLLTIVFVGTASSLATAGKPAASDNWPGFRGPHADGHAGPAGLPVTWSDTQNVRWKTALPGRAWSSPVVWGRQIWMTTATEDGYQMSALCVDRESGKLVFEKKLFDVHKLGESHKFNSFASPTPAIEEGRVYLSWGSYGLACLDTNTFETLWIRRDLRCEHYRAPGSSPVIVDDMLIEHYDGFDYQYVIALDKRTGDTVWLTRRPHDFETDNGDIKKSFATPIVIEVDGRRELISPTSKGVFAYDPATGSELWRARYEQFSCACRPLFQDGVLYLNAGFSKGALVAIRAGGSGDVTDTNILWSQDRGMPNKPSPLLVNGLLFTINDTGIVSCLEPASGKIVWQERIGGNFSSSPITADGRIYMFDEEGKGTVIAADRQFKLLGQSTLPDGCMASPAVVSRSLLVRTRTHIYCLEDKATAAAATPEQLAAAVLLSPSEQPAEAPRIESIDAAMQKFIDDKQAAGIVTLVAHNGQIIHQSALGKANIEADRPMAADTMFWIASMTKPMAATAVLILEDEGKLSVDDPVSKYIPEFEHLKLGDGSPVKETLRIRHLLTHTSGVGGIDLPKVPEKRSLDEQSKIMAAAPLAFEPGSKWSYGWSLQVAGRIVEIVSRKPFDEFLAERIFKPLKMNDATFVLDENRANRMATTYKLNEAKDGIEPVVNKFVSTEPGVKQTPMPSGGLVAPARDVHRFYQMLLNGGELDGVRILKAETVKKMTSRQTGDLRTGFTDGNCWGLGVCVVRQPQGVSEALSPGSFGHGGAYGTQVWCDPQRKTIYLLFLQRSDLPNSDASDFRKTLQDLGRKATE
jgi:outer membrane protein assembly factor BamB